MLLPQKEAREKVCPLLRGPEGQVQCCMGDGCMMWRYRQKDSRGEDAQGYCGLAGKPMGAL
ncbi:hypothetical protein Dde_2449 [Oleidesulfovibrio alaskensis G20]|jgi:hypothetical protein|uniref:Uncharacterized protein n=1 Tax=Oleidesulfovibrio alaskensis (strain ATCC BAA-1058 / DSM 17464 / G20) TaxID=207559 RepID=Q30YK0_OLEA2|nr:hypothetical protein [Oleidesulfovibrio alaskensis]ABB39246.1 hypothetical protein Dde_2449 [Oleidesulfovibrio alaskensis G20]MBG0771999.1 hypothetical protein [Oleidesulfovibrio alaskensis]MBL3581763.1 hypothetical protein [Oleidesulfovibrio alaskensis]